MLCDAAPDGDWAVATNQMPGSQIATKGMSREKTILASPFQVQAVQRPPQPRRRFVASAVVGASESPRQTYDQSRG